MRFSAASDCARAASATAILALPQAEIERLPGDQCADGAAPGGAEIVRAEHRSGDGRDHALRKQHAEDVIAGGAIDLRERVDARQVGGARELDAGGGGVDLLLRHADRRIVLECALDRLRDASDRLLGRTRLRLARRTAQETRAR